MCGSVPLAPFVLDDVTETKAISRAQSKMCDLKMEMMVTLAEGGDIKPIKVKAMSLYGEFIKQVSVGTSRGFDEFLVKHMKEHPSLKNPEQNYQADLMLDFFQGFDREARKHTKR
jgi:hypothetical protein